MPVGGGVTFEVGGGLIGVAVQRGRPSPAERMSERQGRLAEDHTE